MNNIKQTETHNEYKYEVVCDNGIIKSTGQIQNEKAERNGYIRKIADRKDWEEEGHLRTCTNRLKTF
ncbi:MAG: hypothetical protein K2I00_10480 [Ruminococcus sp.]|nr:hypothetical protein [Ruminococcus sp.]